MPSTSGVSVQGIKEAQEKLREIKNKALWGIDTELDRFEQSLKSQAAAQTPYKTGRLESSVISGIKRNKRSISVVVRARNPKTGYDYSLIQHENLMFRHKRGKAKFVEDPFKSLVAKFENYLKSIGRLK